MWVGEVRALPGAPHPMRFQVLVTWLTPGFPSARLLLHPPPRVSGGAAKVAHGFREVGEMLRLCGLRGPEWRGHTSFGKKKE